MVANGLENYDQALEYHERALKIAYSIDDKKLIAQTLNNYGFVYQAMDSLESALRQYEEALTIYQNALQLDQDNPEILANT